MSCCARKRRIRSAEKARVSTCPLADFFATQTIKKYHELVDCPDNLNKVVASVFFDTNEDGNFDRKHFQLVALATGTKHKKDNPGFKDMHAEILVRRALNRWLVDTKYQDTQKSKFHLYVSSAPRGNACIRRWAAVTKETAVDDAEIFSQTHKKISLHAAKEGQISLTVKKEGGGTGESAILPAGVAPYDGTSILTCSDKLAIFNAVGWTNIKLLQYIPRVDITSVTIGRKFARTHAQRALCCRLQDAGIPELRHPTLLCSAVKLDDGGREEDGRFSDTVMLWSATADQAELLDPLTGLTRSGVESRFSTTAILRDANALLTSCGSQQSEIARELKRKAREHLLKYSI